MLGFEVHSSVRVGSTFKCWGCEYIQVSTFKCWECIQVLWSGVHSSVRVRRVLEVRVGDTVVRTWNARNLSAQ